MIKWGEFGGTHYNNEQVKFEFNVGDRVETKYIHFFRWFTRRGTIEKREVSEMTTGDAHEWVIDEKGLRSIGPIQWPVYYVRLDKDGKLHKFTQDKLSL